MRRFLIIGLCSIILLVLLGAAWLSWKFFFTPLEITGHSLTITVPPDITPAKLAAKLYQQGVLRNPRVFTLFIRLQGSFRQVKAGEYRLTPGMTPAELLKKLVQGKVLLNKITLVEGWTFRQMMAAIQADSRLTHTLKDISAEAVMASIDHPGDYPEGMFYPDTYFFTVGAKDRTILAMAYDAMQKRLNDAWRNRDANLPYTTPYQALIVASMIEKEAALNKERPIIAGVILKRLRTRMRLQIDATVIYGLGENYQSRLTRQNLRTDTPYNTYTRQGLPPTPIAMPQEASIQAAVHPQESNALYYVAKGDGSHIFSESLQAHHLAAAKYWSGVKLLDLKKKSRESFALLSRFSVSGKLMLHYWSFISMTVMQQDRNSQIQS